MNTKIKINLMESREDLRILFDHLSETYGIKMGNTFEDIVVNLINQAIDEKAQLLDDPEPVRKHPSVLIVGAGVNPGSWLNLMKTNPSLVDAVMIDAKTLGDHLAEKRPLMEMAVKLERQMIHDEFPGILMDEIPKKNANHEEEGKAERIPKEMILIIAIFIQPKIIL